MCQKSLSLSVLTLLLLTTTLPASAQTYTTGSQVNSSQSSSATYQQGTVSSDDALKDLTPDQVFLDVTKAINPQTGETEFVAPTFDPFEQDDDLAASVTLRSTSEVRDLNNDPMSDGALVEISLYYSDTGDRDFSRAREALYLNGDVVPIIQRDSRELECSSRVTETIYHSDHYYNPGYGGLYRTPPIYLGLSFGGRGLHRGGRADWRRYRARNYGYSSPYYPRHPYRRYDDRRRERFNDRARGQNRGRDQDRVRDRDRVVTPVPAPRHIRRDWGDGQDRRYQEQERFRNNQREDRRPRNRDSQRSDSRNEARNNETRNEGRSDRSRDRVETPAQNDRRAAPPRRSQNEQARAHARVNPPARVRPQPETRPQPRLEPAPMPELRSEPTRSERQPRRSTPVPTRQQRRQDPQEKRPDSLLPRLNMFPDGYSETVVVSLQRDCAREDRLTLFVPTERLEAARFDGLTLILRDISVNQRTGQVTVYDERPLYIPANYIEGFRMAVANP